jgi:hypothetical protein
MRIAYLALFALLPVAAQELKLSASLDKQLSDRARESVDVTLDSSLLQLASRFLHDNDADEARVKKLVAGIKSVYVRSFEFDRAGEYRESDVAEIRAQLKPPVWSRIVGVRSRDGDNAEVFIASVNGQISGLAILSVEPKELTIVSIVGSIRPEDIRDLGGNFGIPKFNIGAMHKGGEKEKED